MNSLIEFIKALGPFITAATPVLLIVVPWLLNRRQTRVLKEHSDSNKAEIIRSGTGTFRLLNDEQDKAK
jgi:hypothetical protein